MPNLVKPDVDNGGAKYTADLVWYYGFLSASCIYIGLNKLWPVSERIVRREEMVSLEVVVEDAIEKADKFDSLGDGT